ncbi:minor tail protein [Gordonia phage Evaa]|nr:minor tail protein [Gordonia phage Evaa]
MSSVDTSRPPQTDAEWARDVQKRLDALDNQTSTRIGEWVLASRGGELVASKADGQTIELSTLLGGGEDSIIGGKTVEPIAPSAIPYWAIKHTGAVAEVNFSPGSTSYMPSGYYNTELRTQGVTIDDLGLGRMQVTSPGMYAIRAASLYTTRQSGSIGTSADANTWRSSPWTLYVNQEAYFGPMLSGDEVEVYLAGGDIVQPGIVAAWPAVIGGGGAEDEVATASAIRFITGGMFMGRKVA